MREAIVSDLVMNLLGPRNGPEEVIEGSPAAEYITGVLAPVDPDAGLVDAGDPEAELHEAVVSRATARGADVHAVSEEDADTGRDPSILSLLSPVLDPKKTPSSMGMTFAVSCAGAPTLDVCVTWGRYDVHATSPRQWKRKPRRFVAGLVLDKNRVVHIGHDGAEVGADDAEISLHAIARTDGRGSRLVSIYVVNRIKVPPGERAAETHSIFQPQIRVVFGKGTEISNENFHGSSSGDGDENEVLYRNKRSPARGHMTSVVWRDVDPEAEHGALALDFPECELRPGFEWADGAVAPAAVRQKFAPCDIRTEFVPMYNVLAPDFSWLSDHRPELEAGAYCDEFDPDRLRQKLLPFDTEYEKWLDRLRAAPVPNDAVKRRLLDSVGEAHGRIRRGIELLCSNRDARLAFCFANRAMDLQSHWHRREGIVFRPFQLAFILMSAESILDAESPDRDVCDLLWVPTGGGKTEAYLFLVAMAAAHRRLRAANSTLGKLPGDGVSVISRYTLRLLTIQQFRRAVSLFTAMECLRVDGLGGAGPVGWRPPGADRHEDFIWGTAQFAVGLWVGRDVTPNYTMKQWSNGDIPGAVDLLRSPSRIDGYAVKGEPAQILSCPACSSLLALPESGTARDAEVHYVAYTDAQRACPRIDDLSVDGLRVLDCGVTEGGGPGVITVSAKIHSESTIKSRHLVRLFDEIRRRLKDGGISARLAAAHESRPGYFLRSYVNTKGREEEYDFQVFCPSPKCPLVRHWASGSPTGSTHARPPDPESSPDSVCGRTARDGNRFSDVVGAFAISRHVADRVPIPALTTDDQVYAALPTMVIGTVDKFARLPFNHKSAALFGEASFHHCVWGYCRRYDDMSLVGGRTKNYIELENPSKPRRPDLVIQDELHLIDGPLGSIFGMYEAVVDKLCSRARAPVKYIASTATTRRSADHVMALFGRRLALFPPPGLDADDRFFVRDGAAHSLDERPGRLYLGVCAPGRGPLTPLVRIWSRMAQSAHDHRLHGRVDPFWTLVGYFNTIRELAGATALHMQDIPDYLRHISPGDPRPMEEEGRRELSGRTSSYDLPAILDLLGEGHTKSRAGLDGLFTTSMFGTGVDISRLGAMLVNGQPKTAAAYIQSTGRVGRTAGAIVVTFYRASKPRDLNNYEFFVRQHSQLHRFVEPPTAFPFAKGARDRTQGPAAVALLRNMRSSPTEWSPRDGAARMGSSRGAREAKDATQCIVGRSQAQPDGRKPPEADVRNGMEIALERWMSVASLHPDLLYSEYPGATKPVVLGDPRHEHEGLDVAYRNAPSSMRDVEEEARFET